MNSLLILLGVVLSALNIYADITPQPGLEIKQMEGTWYEVGLASDKAIFVRMKLKEKAGKALIKATNDGNFDVFYERLKPDGSCSRHSIRATKSSVVGVFKHDKYKGFDVVMTIAETNYKEYAFVVFQMTSSARKAKVISLYVRTMEPSEEVKNKWNKFCTDNGIKDENRIHYPKSGECKPA